MVRLATTLAALLVILALASCGGGGSSTSTPSSGAEPAGTVEATGGDRTDGSPQGGDQGGSGEGESGDQGTDQGGQHSSTPKPPTQVVPLQVSGGGSEPFRVKGGDNSVPNYGSEAAPSELAQAAEAMHAYAAARVEGEWAKACTLLTHKVVAGLEQLAASAPKFKGRGCAPILAAFASEVPVSAERELTVVDAASLRSEGNQAFLLFHGFEDTPYSMPMNSEGGRWKLGAVLPSDLGGE